MRVEDQRSDEHAQGRQDRSAHDAVGLSVERGRDRAETETLAQGVEHAEQRRPCRLCRDEDAEEEGAEAGKPEPTRDGHGCVGVPAPEIEGRRLDGGGPAPGAARHEDGQQDQRLDADARQCHRARRGRGEVGLDELLARRRIARTESRRFRRGLCHAPSMLRMVRRILTQGPRTVRDQVRRFRARSLSPARWHPEAPIWRVDAMWSCPVSVDTGCYAAESCS